MKKMMNTCRKIFLLMLAGLLTAGAATAQNKQEKQVAIAVEELKNAMINADSAKLVTLLSDSLSYGHSGGKIEGKASLIQALVSGHSDFVTIDLSEQKIILYKNTAVVRHLLNATTNDNGKSGTVKLSILTVWVKQNGNWQLVARQAVKPQ